MKKQTHRLSVRIGYGVFVFCMVVLVPSGIFGFSAYLWTQNNVPAFLELGACDVVCLAILAFRTSKYVDNSGQRQGIMRVQYQYSYWRDVCTFIFADAVVTSFFLTFAHSFLLSVMVILIVLFVISEVSGSLINWMLNKRAH